MVAQRRTAVLFGFRGDTQGCENGDERVVGHDNLPTVGVLVLRGNAIAPGQLGERLLLRGHGGHLGVVSGRCEPDGSLRRS